MEERLIAPGHADKFRRAFLLSLMAIISVLQLPSCQVKTETEYFPDGALKYQKELVNADSSIWLVTEWYSDSALKWHGYEINGIRELPDINRADNCHLDVEGNPSSFKLNHNYNIRIRVDGIHPDDFLLYGIGCNVRPIGSNYNYDFQIQPFEKGEMGLLLHVIHNGIPTKVCQFNLLAG